MIVCDTSAIIALIDRDERHHSALVRMFQEDPGVWLLPWAILPEVDYLLATRLGSRVQEAFQDDLVSGAYTVDWGCSEDLERARFLSRRYADLRIGLTDGIVMATAERIRARAIATLDLRHFGVVELIGNPAILPRDTSDG